MHVQSRPVYVALFMNPGVKITIVPKYELFPKIVRSYLPIYLLYTYCYYLTTTYYYLISTVPLPATYPPPGVVSFSVNFMFPLNFIMCP